MHRATQQLGALMRTADTNMAPGAARKTHMHCSQQCLPATATKGKVGGTFFAQFTFEPQNN